MGQNDHAQDDDASGRREMRSHMGDGGCRAVIASGRNGHRHKQRRDQNQRAGQDIGMDGLGPGELELCELIVEGEIKEPKLQLQLDQEGRDDDEADAHCGQRQGNDGRALT
ncbi:MAG: hypothetical protein R2838_25750 [Caldilineaceae bacterium]